MSVTFSGLTPNNYPTNDRAILDYNYIVSVALPNAANTVNTNYLDLFAAAGQKVPSTYPYPTTETVNVKILTTASTAANNKNINIVLQHTGALSNGAVDSGNYANIPTLGAPIKIVTGNATAHAATTTTTKLPPDCLQFIRAQATGEANGGNASDGTLTLELAF